MSATSINPRNIELGNQQVSLVPTNTGDGSQVAIITSRNDPQNMISIGQIAENWATEIQRQGHTCEVEQSASNEVTCSTDLPMTELARMMPDLESRITRELGGGTDSGRAVGAGASGGSGNTGGYGRDGMELTST